MNGKIANDSLHAGTTLFQRARRDEATQRGTSMLELAFLIPVILLLAIGAVDFGRAYYLGIEVAGAARAGAQYGAQNQGTSADTTGMVAAAKASAADVTTWTSGFPTASWGCMCSDGTSQSASCTSSPSCGSGLQVVNYVTVNTKASYVPLIPWPGVPNPVTLSNSVTYQSGQ